MTPGEGIGSVVASGLKASRDEGLLAHAGARDGNPGSGVQLLPIQIPGWVARSLPDRSPNFPDEGTEVSTGSFSAFHESRRTPDVRSWRLEAPGC